jgi:hypothetical protein
MEAKKIEDGGPAFPEVFTDLEGKGGAYHSNTYSAGGMTLRDWFAGQALAGLMANPNVVGYNANCGWSLVNCKPEDVANVALGLGSAMIAARKG